MIDNEVNLAYDKANLALKGQRFDEAEKIYETLLSYDYSSAAWCGIGLSKLGKVLKRTSSFEEAVYCFDKAKSIEPDKTIEIESVFVKGSYDILKELIDAKFILSESKKKAKLNMVTGVGLMVLGASKGSGRDSSLFQQISGAATSAYGAYTIGESINSTEAIARLNMQIDNQINQIRTLVPLKVNNAADYYIAFQNASEQLNSQVLLLAQLNENNGDKTTLIMFWAFLGLFGGHRFYLGHTKIGVLQLLTLGGLGIWWFIDLPQILNGTLNKS
jgi:tetratricopeptide (TPR) repeat protein